MRHAQPVLRRRFPLQGGVPYIKSGLSGAPRPRIYIAPVVCARWRRDQGYGLLAAQRPPRFNYGKAAHAGPGLIEPQPPLPPRWKEAAGFGLIPAQRPPNFNYGKSAHTSLPDVIFAPRLRLRGAALSVLRPATFNYGLPAHSSLPDVVAPVRQRLRGAAQVWTRPATFNYGVAARSFPAQVFQRVRLRLPGTARTYLRPATFNFGIPWHADEAHFIAAWRRSAPGRLTLTPAPHSAPPAAPRSRVVQPAAALLRGSVRTAPPVRFNYGLPAHAAPALLVRTLPPRLPGRVVPGQRVIATVLQRRAGAPVLAWVCPRRGRGTTLRSWHPFAIPSIARIRASSVLIDGMTVVFSKMIGITVTATPSGIVVTSSTET